MKTIAWQTTGEGNCHLVLLHGWGLNAQVWDCIAPELNAHFTLHRVDLPGYGRSGGFGALSLEDMAEKIRLGQTDQLDVVASHDAIRGMLVDLYM